MWPLGALASLLRGSGEAENADQVRGAVPERPGVEVFSRRELEVFKSIQRFFQF